MKKSYVFVLAAIAASGFAVSAQAQSSITVSKSEPVQPYIITGDGVVEKDGLGNCLRSNNYSADLIKSVKTTDGKPVGVACGEIKEDVAPIAPPPAAQAKPATSAAPAPAAAPSAPESKKVSLPSDALFAYDKADLNDLGKDNLKTFSDNAKKLKQLEVIIAVGHADRIGSAAYNQKLSEKRAAAVKDYLIGQGIPANKVYTEGKGSSQPVTGKSCDKLGAAKRGNKKLIDCLAPDRRVELEAVGIK